MSSAPYRNLEEDLISVDSAGSQSDAAKFSSQPTDGKREYNVEVVGMDDLSSNNRFRRGAEGLKYSRKCMLSIIFITVFAFLLILLVAIIAHGSNSKESAVESFFPWKDIRLPTSIKPQQYDIFLVPDLTHQFVMGNVSIIIHVNGTPNFIVIHAKNMMLNHTQLNEMDSSFKVVSPSDVEVKSPIMSEHLGAAYFGLSKNLKDGSIYQLNISFTYNRTEGLSGFYFSKYQEDNVTKVIGSTQMEPIDARRAFPCFDEPQLRANFTLKIVHDASNDVVLFNTPKSKTEPFGDASRKRLLTTFETTLSMSTYLVAFVICEFSNITTTTSSGTQVSVFSRREEGDQMQLALDAANKTIPFYESYFQLPYPLPKQDMVAIPNFAAGAMENWGLILYRESALLFKEGVTRAYRQQYVVVVIAHELAHQWFGNLVTMKWWDDLWLNEGFASYMEYVGTDNFRPEWNMMDQFIVDTTHEALARDALSESHPISVEIRDPDEIGARFDTITYSKGAAVIRMIHDYLGQDVFEKGLQIYLKRHAYNNTQTSDLWEALREASEANDKEVDVKDLMDYWTLQMGYPLVTFKKDKGKIHVTQEQFLIYPSGAPTDAYTSKFNYKWKIPLTYTYYTGPNTQSGSILVSPDEDAVFDVPSDIGWIKGNVNQSGFYRVNYNADNWKALTTVLLTDHGKMQPADRASIIDDAFHLFRAQKVDLEVPFEMIDYLKHERHYVPFVTTLDNLIYIRGVLQFHKLYDNFTIYLEGVLSQAMTDLTMEDTGDHLKKILRGRLVDFLLNNGHPETLKWAADNFVAYKNGSSTVGVNLAPIMKCGGVRTGREEDWNFVWEQFKSNKIASEKYVLLRAVTCTRDPAILTWLLFECLENRYIRSQDGISTIQYIFENPVGANIATNFVMENWDQLAEKYGSDLFALTRLVPKMTSWISGEVQSFHVLEFLNTKYESVPLGLQTAILQATEQLEVNVEFVKWSAEKMEQWLAEKLSASM
ncbi:aminopeptidase Ey-like isoform X2 [Apostichopus japonicus]